MEWFNMFRSFIDVGIVAFLFYKIMVYAQGTRAMKILKGTGVIVAVWLLSGYLGLETLKFILSQLLLYGLLGLMVIFQPEFRNALEKLGRRNFGSIKGNLTNKKETDYLIGSLTSSIETMSKHKIGALISIEMEDSLQEYINTGIELNAKHSKELLENIFAPNVPLHDGALIIRGNKLEAASCYLPLSEDGSISKELGTRHRAGIGLSEVTDALTLIVSEETGSVSLAKDNNLIRGITLEELKNHLDLQLAPKVKKSQTLRNKKNKKSRRSKRKKGDE